MCGGATPSQPPGLYMNLTKIQPGWWSNYLGEARRAVLCASSHAASLGVSWEAGLRYQSRQRTGSGQHTHTHTHHIYILFESSLRPRESVEERCSWEPLGPSDGSFLPSRKFPSSLLRAFLTCFASSALESCYQDRVGNGWEVAKPKAGRPVKRWLKNPGKRKEPLSGNQWSLRHLVLSILSFLLASWARANHVVFLSFKLLINKRDDNYLFLTALLDG